MKKFILVLFIEHIGKQLPAQTESFNYYKKSEVMKLVRDGVKLNMVIFSPANAMKPSRICIRVGQH